MNHSYGETLPSELAFRRLHYAWTDLGILVKQRRTQCYDEAVIEFIDELKNILNLMRGEDSAPEEE